MLTLRAQLADVATRWVNAHYARWMMEGDPRTLAAQLAARAWLEGRPEDHDTAVIRAVYYYKGGHGPLPLDALGVVEASDAEPLANGNNAAARCAAPAGTHGHDDCDLPLPCRIHGEAYAPNLRRSYPDEAAPLATVQPRRPFSERIDTIAEDVRAIVRELVASRGADAALAEVVSLWSNLDACSRLVESQTHLLLRQMPVPELPPVPAWADEAIATFSSEVEQPVLVNAVETARSLLGMLAQEGLGSDDIRIEAGGNGRVSLEVSMSSARVHWMIQTADIAWPGVSILAVERPGSRASAKRTVRSYHRAQDALDALLILRDSSL